MKNLFKIFFLLTLLVVNFYADTNKLSCEKKGENFIFSGGECIEFYKSDGEEKKSINIIVHGTWKKGTNTLGRYAPFADNIAMATDITTIAIALPGYSNSSTNNIKDLNDEKNNVYTKKYINFTSALIKALKSKFKAQKVNYIGHSAGATLGANVIALNSSLINTLSAAGGRYDLNKFKNKSNLVSLSEHLDKIKDTKILLIYGTKDKISKPEVSISFYEKIKDKKLNVKLVEVKDAAHLDLDMTDTAVEAISEMLSND